MPATRKATSKAKKEKGTKETLTNNHSRLSKIMKQTKGEKYQKLTTTS
jgi:hypothetical protein